MFFRTILFASLLLGGVNLAAVAQGAPPGDLEKRFREYGLVDISTLDPTIKVDLRYATTDNFTGKNMYGDLDRAYFVPEIAKMIVRVQKKLRERYPGYSLLIYDAARPVSVQRKMFSAVAGTPLNMYVANPAKGGRHNYGVAVDLTIIDARGNPLDMGSGFDHFGPASHAGGENELVKHGIISSQARKNRAILTDLMKEEGFSQHPMEWWHFHKYSVDQAAGMYRLLDF